MKSLMMLPFLVCGATLTHAQPVQGFYAAGAAGGLLSTTGADSTQQAKTSPDVMGPPDASTTANAQINSGFGTAQSASVGWGLGNGARVEIQGLHTGQNLDGNP